MTVDDKGHAAAVSPPVDSGDEEGDVSAELRGRLEPEQWAGVTLAVICGDIASGAPLPASSHALSQHVTLRVVSTRSGHPGVPHHVNWGALQYRCAWWCAQCTVCKLHNLQNIATTTDPYIAMIAA